MNTNDESCVKKSFLEKAFRVKGKRERSQEPVSIRKIEGKY